MKIHKLLFCSLFIIVSVYSQNTKSGKYLYKDPTCKIMDRVEDLLNRMTLDEKIMLLHGDSTGFGVAENKRLGIPPLHMCDGPVGVRINKATAFPAAICMAASWDTAMIYRYGIALANETKAKGKNVILGPCVGIHRYPLSGRNFESFGEDPFLTSKIAVPFIKGVQSQNILTSVKHFACNDQEWERNNYDVIVGERALREIHLPAFEAAVKDAKVWTVMAANNAINGHQATENKHLQLDILKNEWGFTGIIMSDWLATYSTKAAANNGLDLEMPDPMYFNNNLKRAVTDGIVSMPVVDDKVRRHLRVRFEAGFFDNPMPIADEAVCKNNTHKGLALEMAQKGMVLVKNTGVLPLVKNKVKSIAVIGPIADIANVGGGGSALVTPYEAVTALQGIKNIAGKNVKVNYASGVQLIKSFHDAIPSQYLKTPDGKSNGLLGEYFATNTCDRDTLMTRIDKEIDLDFRSVSETANNIKKEWFSVRWTGKFIPPVTDEYTLYVAADDGARLYIDGKLVIKKWGLSDGVTEEFVKIKLEANKEYDVKLEYFAGPGLAKARFGWSANSLKKPAVPNFDEAIALAKKSDIAVVCVGNVNWLEGESFDVNSMDLYGYQDKLIQAVTKANPNTIVVLWGGCPFTMESWITDAKAVLLAWYPGQEGGDAIAQILFGKVNPSGKLPFSYIKNESQSPAFNGYKDLSLNVNYDEGIYVGYRYLDKNKIEPMFPFGYGLSYSTYEYSNLKLNKIGDKKFTVTVDIKNTGKFAGEEIVQFYVNQNKCSVDRPEKELKGFSKVKIAPNTTETVSITLNENAFSFYDVSKNKWVVEPGNFTVLVGSSSKEIKLKQDINIQ